MSVAVAEPERWCRHCSTWKSPHEFGRKVDTRDGLNVRCLDCQRRADGRAPAVVAWPTTVTATRDSAQRYRRKLLAAALGPWPELLTLARGIDTLDLPEPERLALWNVYHQLVNERWGARLMERQKVRRTAGPGGSPISMHDLF